MMTVEKVIRATTKVKKKDRGLVHLALVTVCLVALAVIVPSITNFAQYILSNYFSPTMVTQPMVRDPNSTLPKLENQQPYTVKIDASCPD